MWNAVAEHLVERLTAAWQTALDQGVSAVPRLRGLVAAQLQQITATPSLPMLLFSRELTVENDTFRDAFRNALTSYHAKLVTEIMSAQRSGTLRGDITAGDIGSLLTSLVQGVAIRWTLGARNFNLREEGLRLLDVQLRLLAGKER